jgi:hypothetical protein
MPNDGNAKRRKCRTAKAPNCVNRGGQTAEPRENKTAGGALFAFTRRFALFVSHAVHAFWHFRRLAFPSFGTTVVWHFRG